MKEHPLSTRLHWLEGVPDERMICIVPHQDDETVFSIPLYCHPHMHVVHVTDGAPLDTAEWKGYPTREAYAAKRKQELDDALAVVGHVGPRIALSVVDGATAQYAAEISQELYELFVSNHTTRIFTLAYEGGHPDHDTTAFAVHTAARRLTWPAHIIEAPAYRMSHDDPQGPLVWQRFAPYPDITPIELELTDEEQDRKRCMFAAHSSQSGIFPHMSATQELFRIAPHYNFSKPPNNGLLSSYYARVGLDFQTWHALTTASRPL